MNIVYFFNHLTPFGWLVLGGFTWLVSWALNGNGDDPIPCQNGWSEPDKNGVIYKWE
jgi:hypothetical protein